MAAEPSVLPLGQERCRLCGAAVPRHHEPVDPWRLPGVPPPGTPCVPVQRMTPRWAKHCFCSRGKGNAACGFDTLSE